jgi:hypothetical protein
MSDALIIISIISNFYIVKILPKLKYIYELAPYI